MHKVNLPRTQRAAILVEPGRLEIRDDVPVPEPEAGELLVRVDAATTCGTDLKMYRRGHPLFAPPVRFGHEFAGTVAALGEGVTRFAPGDAVMAVHSAPCGTCRYCERGLQNHCKSLLEKLALGTYGEYVLLSARHVALNVYPRPATVPAPVASLLEPLSCVVYGWRLLGLSAARHAGVQPVVLVYGAGAIALMYLLLARADSDARVVVVARRPEARQRALAFGAEAAVSPDEAAATLQRLNDGYLADAAIDCTGAPSVWEHCSNLVDLGGEVLYFGGCPSGTTITLDTRRVHYDQLHLHGVFHFDTTAVREASEWITSGKLALADLLEETHKLDELPQLFAHLEQQGGALKQVIEPN